MKGSAMPPGLPYGVRWLATAFESPENTVKTMRIRKGLVLWNLRQLRNVTLVAVPVAVAYTAFAPDYLTPQLGWPPAFVLGHSIAIAVCLGRFRTAPFGYLYSRGFGRDTLWAHAMLATATGVLIVWLAASLTLWLGIRSFVQNLLESPYYPGIMEPRDALVPWAWLAMYAVALPFAHYAWIREAYPAAGGNVGKILVALLVPAGYWLLLWRYPFPNFPLVLITAGLTVAAVVLTGGRLVHRRMEVQG